MVGWGLGREPGSEVVIGKSQKRECPQDAGIKGTRPTALAGKRRQQEFCEVTGGDAGQGVVRCQWFWLQGALRPNTEKHLTPPDPKGTRNQGWSSSWNWRVEEVRTGQKDFT